MKEEIEGLKNNARGICNLSHEYEVWEVLQALVMDDTVKLAEIRSRLQVLNRAYDNFVTDVDSGDEDRKQSAINSFKRP